MAKKKTVITIEPTKYYTIPVVAKWLGYSDRSGVAYLVRTGKIPQKYLSTKKTVSNQKQMILGEWVLGLSHNK